MITIGVNKTQSVSASALDNEFTFTTGFQLEDNELTFNPAWRGVIKNRECTNLEQVVLDIPFADEGLERIEIVVFDTNGNFVRIPGEETDGIPTAPTVLPNTLLATFYKVTDNSISDPADLDQQGMMIDKLYTWVMLLSFDIARIEGSLNAQKTIVVDTMLDNTYNNAIVKVKSNAVITIPHTITPNFSCVFRCYTGVTATFAAYGFTDFDAPSGTVLEEGKMATIYRDGSTNTVIISGELTT